MITQRKNFNILLCVLGSVSSLPVFVYYDISSGISIIPRQFIEPFILDEYGLIEGLGKSIGPNIPIGSFIFCAVIFVRIKNHFDQRFFLDLFLILFPIYFFELKAIYFSVSLFVLLFGIRLACYHDDFGRWVGAGFAVGIGSTTLALILFSIYNIRIARISEGSLLFSFEIYQALISFNVICFIFMIHFFIEIFNSRRFSWGKPVLLGCILGGSIFLMYLQQRRLVILFFFLVIMSYFLFCLIKPKINLRVGRDAVFNRYVLWGLPVSLGVVWLIGFGFDRELSFSMAALPRINLWISRISMIDSPLDMMFGNRFVEFGVSHNFLIDSLVTGGVVGLLWAVVSLYRILRLVLEIPGFSLKMPVVIAIVLWNGANLSLLTPYFACGIVGLLFYSNFWRRYYP